MHSARNSTRARRLRAALVVMAAAVASVVAGPVPAASAAPVNDDWEAATEVSNLPFEDTVDTTTATKDSVSPDLGRYRTHSVWYRVSLPADGKVLVSTEGTDFTHKVAMFQADDGSGPAEWTMLKAKRGSAGSRTGFTQPVEAGTDYYVSVSAPRRDPGGTAHIMMREPTDFDLSLSGSGDFDTVDGSAILHGLMSSDRPTEIYVYVALRQLVGERVVNGAASRVLVPTTDQETWDLVVSSEWAFKPGPAKVVYSRVDVFDAGIRIARFAFERDIVTLE